MRKKMKNETEFEFDEVLSMGFTTVPNSIFESDLTFNAIGVYCTIIKMKNANGWKIYQSTLINGKNGRTKVMNAMKELIVNGWIEKIQLRNEKGQLCGVKYIVRSTPTISQPKSEKPTSDKPNSVNVPLQIKNKINKENKNKDLNKLSSSIKNNNNTNISNSKEENIEEDSFESDLKLLMSFCNNVNYKLSKVKAKAILVVYSVDKVIKAITHIINTVDISAIRNFGGYLMATLKDITAIKNVTIQNNIEKTDNSKNKLTNFNNFTQREYDYDKLEQDLLYGGNYEEETPVVSNRPNPLARFQTT